MAIGKAGSLNRIFSKSTLKHILNDNVDELYHHLAKVYVSNCDFLDNGSIFTHLYNILDSSYRNEYFYKNTIFNKLLLEKYGMNRATALSELPVAKSKADFVIVNGFGVVYEIKTEYDNYERLITQIEDYYKAFDRVYVVTSYKKQNQLFDFLKGCFLDEVGIMILTEDGKLRTKKKAKVRRADIDKSCLFSMLRKAEFEKVLLDCNKQLPQVPSYEYYDKCRVLFCSIPLSILYKKFLGVLKNRIHFDRNMENIPYSLRSLTYFALMKESEYCRYEKFLHMHYGGETQCIIHT